jgi:hypothetical protein
MSNKSTKPEKKSLPKFSDLGLIIEDNELNPNACKLLVLKLNPATCFLSTKDKAEIIGVTDRTVRNIEANKKFQSKVTELVKENLGQAVPEVWQAFIANAISGDTTAQIRFLEECGVITKREHGNKNNINLIQNMTADQIAEQRAKRTRKGLAQFGYKVDSD